MFDGRLIWLWMGLLLLMITANAISFYQLLSIKKTSYTELWNKDLTSETFLDPAARKVYFELKGGMPKWVRLNDLGIKWYRVFRWSQWFALALFIIPLLSLFVVSLIGS